MAISQDAIAAAIPARLYPFLKASATSEGAGTFHSLWKLAGIPAAGSNPPAFGAGSGYIPTRATAGAFGQVNPTANLYLALLAAATTVVGQLFVYDRLWACSGFGTVVTTAQTVTTPGTLTAGRDPNSGADVEPWIEVYTAPGATTATWTLTGTDAAGNTNRTWVYTHPANAETAGQMMPMFPGGGSPAATLGCRVVTSFTCSVSSGTAGDVGITLLRRLSPGLPMPFVGPGNTADHFQLGLPEVFDDSCLAMMVLCSTTTTGLIIGQLALPELTP